MPSRTALASVVALVLGSVLMLVLHVIPPTDEISPMRRTLSQYALTSNKWLFDVAVLLIALGSVLAFATVVVVRAARPRRADDRADRRGRDPHAVPRPSVA